MDEPRHILATLDGLPAGEEAVLATVVDVVGSGYRRPGARMLLTRGGDRVGGVSGGCLEADLMRRAFALTANGPQCVDYDTRGDEEHPTGKYDTGCEGVIRVLVERVTPETAADSSHPLAALRSLPDADEPVAAATVYCVDGNVGASVGDGAVLSSDGTSDDHRNRHGTPRRQPRVGEDHATDPRLPPRRRDRGMSGSLVFDCSFAPGLLARAIRDDLEVARESPNARSQVYELPTGRAHVLLEPLRPPRDLVIFGAGDDARPLVRLAAGLGWRVTVADKRPTWADARLFPGAKRVICAAPDDTLRRLRLREETAVVLMTHSLGDDAALLPEVLKSPAGYVGLLGPKSRAAKLMIELHRRGELPDAAALARLHAPVGLDLGSAEPAGVALSILSQIEASFNGRDGGPLSGRTRGIHEPHARGRRDLRDVVPATAKVEA